MWDTGKGAVSPCSDLHFVFLIFLFPLMELRGACLGISYNSLLLLHTLFDQSLGSPGIFLLMKLAVEIMLCSKHICSLCEVCFWCTFSVIKINSCGMFFFSFEWLPHAHFLTWMYANPTACHQILYVLLYWIPLKYVGISQRRLRLPGSFLAWHCSCVLLVSLLSL